MSRVVIAGRTAMQNLHVCIGGHDLDDDFRPVRLLDAWGRSWWKGVPFTVGEVWNVTYAVRPDCERPHVEDVLVQDYGDGQPLEDLKGLVLEHAVPWIGLPEMLFERTVGPTPSGTAYIPAGGPLPRCSTGYWLPSRDLTRFMYKDKPRFLWTGPGAIKRIAWTGEATPPEHIAAGSLLRVSLSRRFGSETAPEGYYVQISGVL